MSEIKLKFAQENLWGWQEFFVPFYENVSKELKSPILARVISESHGIYQIQIPSLNKQALSRIRGKIHFQTQDREALPAVGDWVVIDGDSGAEGELRIEGVLPRKSVLRRKAPRERGYNQVFASNIDEVWVATSLNHDFSENRLDRILSLIAEGGAMARVLLTKADLVSDGDLKNYEKIMQSRFPGVEYIFVSSLEDYSIQELNNLLKPAHTYLMVGSSGVGKSTIINKLLGEELLLTQEVREIDSKGRHTTTHRQLVKLEGGAIFVDTPGVREWQLLDTEESIANFEDVEALFVKCRFTNCRHENEPACAVRNAIAEGSLAMQRWDSYLRLISETQFQMRKKDAGIQSVEKNKWKKTHNNQKTHYKKKR